jgi:hypothetical protein
VALPLAKTILSYASVRSDFETGNANNA